MKRNFLTMMLFSAVALTMGCAQSGSTENKFGAYKLVECEFSTKESTSQIKAIFESATILPLEQSEDSMVASNSELLEFNGDYYLIDKQQRSCHRFDKDGKFKNVIGHSGRAGNEYLDIASVQADGDDILIYSTLTQKLYRYSVEGEFLGATETGIRAQQLLKADNKYYGYFGYDNGQQEERVLLYNDAFEPIGRYLPSSAKLIVFSEGVAPISQQGDVVNVRETYSNCIFQLLDDGEVSTPIAFDFGKYNIPPEVFTQTDPMKAVEIMLAQDFASIVRYKATPSCSLVEVIFQMTDQTTYSMVGVSDENDNFKWITTSTEGDNAMLYFTARNTSEDGTVTALVDQDFVKEFDAKNKGFFTNIEAGECEDNSNPFIVKFKISR
ncbi:MAG: 6-bladed beta-propeller [Rikenellaceae bacterium]